MAERASRRPQSLKKDKSYGSLIHDDILIDIISWLPVKDVLRWRCVSRKWKNLTSTPDFEKLHMRHIRRSNPMILIEYDIRRSFNSYDNVITDKFFADRWWEPRRNTSTIHSFALSRGYCTDFSQDGLLLMKLKSGFIIFNPVNSQKVNILYPESLVYGVFWHPNLNEYCVIFAKWSRHPPINFTYNILNIGSNPCLRGIRNPHNINVHLLDPVYVGSYLCRTVVLQQHKERSILEFDTRSEEFTLISYPSQCLALENMNLLNIDGLLSIVHICYELEQIRMIKIWILKDREKQEWVCCDYKIRCAVCPSQRLFRAIAFVDEKLVVTSYDINGVFICDIRKGIARTFKIATRLRGVHLFCSHVMSLVSFGDCKSEINVKSIQQSR